MSLNLERIREYKQRWSTARELMLGPATDLMLDLAVGTNMIVLDVAAGTGDQTFRAARRVGPHGRVLATDIGDEVLQFAASEAHDRGIHNVEFRAMPCEQLTEPAATFDAVICRNGLQYVSDLTKGLAEVYRVLKTGGRLSVVAWSSPERNKFLSQSFATAYRKLGIRPQHADEPWPFRFGQDTALKSALEGARFREVGVTAVSAPAVFTSANDALAFQQLGAGELLRLIDRLSEVEKASLWLEIEEGLRAFEHDGSFRAEGELFVGCGTK
jgi:ubiquinone/menaquinone biosynthesis C-methylase UbiE